LLFDKNACIMAVTTKKEKAQMLPASELPQPGVNRSYTRLLFFEDII
jgi:hypothetical protein